MIDGRSEFCALELFGFDGGGPVPLVVESGLVVEGGVGPLYDGL